MLSGLHWQAVGGGEEQRECEIQLESRMRHQLFAVSNLISSYLLYVDSSKVPSRSRAIKPDRLPRRNPDLPTLVLVLQNARERGDKRRTDWTIWENYDWGIDGIARGLTREWLDYRTHFSHICRHDFLCATMERPERIIRSDILKSNSFLSCRMRSRHAVGIIDSAHRNTQSPAS